MKKILVTLSLLLTLGLSTASVAAQTDPIDAPDLEGLEAAYDVEGLQSVHDRTFSVDFEAMMASPDQDAEAGGIDVSAMMNMISIQGMTFDSEDNANAYLDQMNSDVEAAMEDEENAEMLESVEITSLDDFDVDGIRVITSMPDLDVNASMIVFTDGNYVFQIMVMNSDLDTAQSTADEVTQFVIDAEVETEEVTFSDDGTSTGGVYDRMPTADDDVVGDLTGVMDMELHVADE